MSTTGDGKKPPRTRREAKKRLDERVRERAACEGEGEDADVELDVNGDPVAPARLGRDASQDELRNFFARTPSFAPFAHDLESLFAANIDARKLFTLAESTNDRGWTELTRLLLDGDTTA